MKDNVRYSTVEENEPMVLTLETLEFGFVIWLIACGIATIEFILELLMWPRVMKQKKAKAEELRKIEQRQQQQWEQQQEEPNVIIIAGEIQTGGGVNRWKIAVQKMKTSRDIKMHQGNQKSNELISGNYHVETSVGVEVHSSGKESNHRDTKTTKGKATVNVNMKQQQSMIDIDEIEVIDLEDE
jgi:lipopolysaccharide export LptBFGC system permease protein LptF